MEDHVGKGDQTREHILERASGLFNRRGVAGAALSDIMEATGLTKGGIYRHFESKEVLALQAFDYAAAATYRLYVDATREKSHAVDRLRAIIRAFTELLADPPVPGGCPLMNAAIDSDDGSQALRSRARAAMDELLGLMARTTREGQERGEIRRGVDADSVATVLVSTLEGSLMLARLYDDRKYLDQAAAHLMLYLDEQARAE